MKLTHKSAQLYNEKVNHLHNLIRGMNLPGFRKTTETIEGFRWLLKNMDVYNSDHPNYKEAEKTIKELLESQNCSV